MDLDVFTHKLQFAAVGGFSIPQPTSSDSTIWTVLRSCQRRLTSASPRIGEALTDTFQFG